MGFTRSSIIEAGAVVVVRESTVAATEVGVVSGAIAGKVEAVAAEGTVVIEAEETESVAGVDEVDSEGAVDVVMGPNRQVAGEPRISLCQGVSSHIDYTSTQKLLGHLQKFPKRWERCRALHFIDHGCLCLDIARDVERA